VVLPDIAAAPKLKNRTYQEINKLLETKIITRKRTKKVTIGREQKR
jgi:hypothetical protein